MAQLSPDRRYFIGEHGFNAPKVPPALYIVATPIGNLKDITLRALEVLAGADLILCEDTRTSAKLLSAFGIKTRRRALHEHNESEMAAQFVRQVQDGAAIALISDAGTPLLSDPGFPLVREAAKSDIEVVALPGASALLAGLAVAGLPTDQFSFFGFLPPKQMARKERLKELSGRPETLVFYESPKRVSACLSALAEIFGDNRQAVVAREITKKFETLYRGSLGELSVQFADQNVKGELVILVAGAQADKMPDQKEWQAVLAERLEELPLRSAVDEVAQGFGLKRKQVYQAALELKK
ncbi:16S rRNA (cytidine(1402)-2'-O)-methyltransferase [Maritalea mediterranea]|uniref:Ribosomal RNA small subunit methyltransferase I n=1 Tax=Maritalea mediterranea TaxID=2909667 RepID=A0ABS9E284_9HYPH|nr:16S rRNA (cytidine(1402)-2'-O)-methyltransferase [Maritalea mediterranea]MCF4096970.1 16S rRNA (cytidine(1402)-2'-O)-methyltransferase [Maritalea mediterranea]